jgi:capsular exopolysaccharide synthesis family protein
MGNGMPPQQPQLGPSAQQEEPNTVEVLRQYAHIIWKRFWVVIAAIAICLGGAFWYTTTRPRLYRASASVEISFQSPRVLGDDIDQIAQSSDWWAGKTFLETQYKILKSRTIALKAAKRLKNEDIWLLLNKPPEENRAATKEEIKEASDVIRDGLEIEPIKDSRVVLVKFSHTDPGLAATVANNLADAYIDDNLTRRLSSTKGASLWLDEQLETLRRQLDDAELAIHNFKKENNILSVSLEDRINILSRRIQTLSAKSDEAMTERLALEAEMAQLERIRNVDDPINDPALAYVKKPVIEALKEQYVKAYMKLVELRGRYMEKHPKIQAQQALLAAIRRDLEREALLELKVLKAKQRALAGTEGRYKAALKSAKKEGLELARKAIEFNRLKRTEAHTEKLYEMVLSRFKETDLAKELRTNNVRMMDRARVPAVPYSPKTHLNLAIGFALGLLLGVGLAFLLHFLDNTIKSQEDIERILGTASLGWVPSIKPEKSTAQDPTKFPELYLYNHPKSSLAEACRSVRTNLLFMSADKPLQSLLITSSAPREGKTTVAMNLATVMAMAGSKTVIIDTDMRRPRLHKAFGISNETGISLAIVGEASIEDVAKSTEVPNLDIIPRGPSTPNPAELLHSDKFKRVLEALKEKYDRVIFDSPPVQAVTDPVILSGTVDGTIVVLKAGVTAKDMAARVVRQLRDVGGRVLGCILNDLDPNRKAYGYGGYYYYRRGHYYYEHYDSQEEA